jgi:hypothetical protein
MADEIVYVLHRAVRVSRDSPASDSPGDVEYQHIDAKVPFSIREASDDEVQEADQKRKDDVDARIARLHSPGPLGRLMARPRPAPRPPAPQPKPIPPRPAPPNRLPLSN